MMIGREKIEPRNHPIVDASPPVMEITRGLNVSENLGVRLWRVWELTH